jgi:hypothetical protein
VERIAAIIITSAGLGLTPVWFEKGTLTTMTCPRL